LGTRRGLRPRHVRDGVALAGVRGTSPHAPRRQSGLPPIADGPRSVYHQPRDSPTIVEFLRLIIQRAVEEEFDQWLGRGRYERRPERRRGLRNGFRPRHVQTAEGELRIEIPQVREAALPFVSKLFPKWHCKRLLRTDPLKALVIGGFVRGLSMRDVESLCEEAGLGRTSKSTVATICAELHERFQRSVVARSTTSTWSCCSSTPSTSRSAPAARRRA
jgi:hypothetical protein